jgi:hypothetical protein
MSHAHTIRNRRRLGFQTLERRTMMAGDVAVQLSADGVLQITGDDAANSVEVRQIGADAFEIKGLTYGGSATTINGKGTGISVKGEVLSIHASMHGANDSFTLLGIGDIPNMLDEELRVETGAGSDHVEIRTFSTVGNWDIVTDPTGTRGSGSDKVIVDEALTFGAVSVSTGAGGDRIQFFATEPYGLNIVHQGYHIDSGWGTTGADKVLIEDLFTWQGIDVLTSETEDQVLAKNVMAYYADLTIQTGGGNDTVELSGSYMDWQSSLATYATSVRIVTGDGSDTVKLKEVVVRGDIDVKTGDAADEVDLSEVHARQAIFASLGSGDDELKVHYSSAKLAYMDGGDQDKTDTLDEMANDFDEVVRVAWEHYV